MWRSFTSHDRAVVVPGFAIAPRPARRAVSAVLDRGMRHALVTCMAIAINGRLWGLLGLFALGCSSNTLAPDNDAGDPSQDAPVAADATDAPATVDAAAADGPSCTAFDPWQEGCPCHTKVYRARGCGTEAPPQMCVNGVAACAMPACSCEGKIIIGCNGAYSEPYAYTFCQVAASCGDFWSRVGMPCDPAGCGADVCPLPTLNASAAGGE